jgi:acyl carrier protein
LGALDAERRAVFEALACCLAALIGHRPDHLADETTFDADLGLESLDRLELLVLIEDRYGVVLPDAQLVTPTVGEVVDAICGRFAATGGS